MEASEKPEFALALAAMLETFGQEATKPILHGYWLGLSDLSLEQVQRSVVTAMRECERVPKPVELRKLAGAYVDGDARAMAAWSDVLRAVELGPYKHIDFADKLINATIRNLGGWPGFLSRFTDSEAEKWARLEFLKTYTSFANSGLSGELLAPLPGLSQQTAVGGVLMLPVPVRVECDGQRASLPSAVQRRLESQSKGELVAIEFRRA